ncbi:MAG: sulfite exporter TauE/SafE family protein [Fibrobacter sp.]|mgnify:CR=1 FL=1|nr:sulfite exporter TauE/SafE family protein [Fibrobacter sp.]
MDSVLIDIGTAIWLGILTSISPCPLATNIAAISYVSRKVEKTRLVLFAGLLYTLGRTLAYLGVALLVSRSLQMIPGVSMFLQKYMNLFIGPLLVVVGILLLGIFNISFGGGMSGNLQKRVDRMGLWGSGLLGFVFALAFCPVSAGLFFGALIPLAVKGNSALMSSLYGIGTALPVIAFALILAFAANFIGTAFKKLTVIEIWVRRITAMIMLLAGIYLILQHNFGLNI